MSSTDTTPPEPHYRIKDISEDNLRLDDEEILEDYREHILDKGYDQLFSSFFSTNSSWWFSRYSKNKNRTKE